MAPCMVRREQPWKEIRHLDVKVGGCADPTDLGAKWTVNIVHVQSHQEDGYLPPTVFFCLSPYNFIRNIPDFFRGTQWGMACIETSLEILEEVTP